MSVLEFLKNLNFIGKGILFISIILFSIFSVIFSIGMFYLLDYAVISFIEPDDIKQFFIYGMSFCFIYFTGTIWFLIHFTNGFRIVLSQYLRKNFIQE